MNYPAWQIKTADPAAEQALAGAGCGALLRRVLAARGCTDPAEVQALLGAGAELSDPFLLRDMDKAVARIEVTPASKFMPNPLVRSEYCIL